MSIVFIILGIYCMVTYVLGYLFFAPVGWDRQGKIGFIFSPITVTVMFIFVVIDWLHEKFYE